MRHLFRLAILSAWNRRGTLSLSVVSIALSVSLLLGVQYLRGAAHESFSRSVSGTDLVVGARTSPIQLMLYAIFRLGDATNNIRWSSVEALEKDPAVAWVVPLSLGDSHKGFPVLATSQGYFDHFRYGYRQPLVLREGTAFKDGIPGLFQIVLGSEVARELGDHLGQRLLLSHGMGGEGLTEHTGKPFTVVGILAPTGTPVDRTLHINMASMEAIHLDWQGGAPLPGFSIPAELVRKFDLTPKEATAALVGLKNRAAVFGVQRRINDGEREPLLAVMPGVALDQLWQLLSTMERTLLAVSAMVVAVGIAGLVAVVLSSLGERRRELAILRSVGAGGWHITFLLVAESFAITLLGALLGCGLMTTIVLAAGETLQARYGLVLQASLIQPGEWEVLAAVMVAGTLAGLLPAWRARRIALADGMTPKV
jgi:putative ABC transport system permease protein